MQSIKEHPLINNENPYKKIIYTTKNKDNISFMYEYEITNKKNFLHFLINCYLENKDINNLNYKIKFDDKEFDNWFYITKSFIISLFNINHKILSETLYCFYNENYVNMLPNFENLDEEDKINIRKSFDYKNPMASFVNYLIKKYLKKKIINQEQKLNYLNIVCKFMYNKIRKM